MRHLAICILGFLICSCAPTCQLTIRSQPEGAYITDIVSGRGLGIAPIVLPIDFDKLTFHTSGCYTVGGIRAQWVSGAQTAYGQLTFCQGQRDYNFLASRDTSQPGLEKDLQFALQLEQLRAEQAQANAANDAAAAALMGAFSKSLQSYKQQPSVRCYTQATGNTVQTACH